LIFDDVIQKILRHVRKRTRLLGNHGELIGESYGACGKYHDPNGRPSPLGRWSSHAHHSAMQLRKLIGLRGGTFKVHS
jgi:hypothetical protein